MRDVQTAADVAIIFIENAFTRFEEAAVSLLKTIVRQEKLLEDLRRLARDTDLHARPIWDGGRRVNSSS